MVKFLSLLVLLVTLGVLAVLVLLSVPERRYLSIESARSQSDNVIIDGSYNPDAIPNTYLETATASRTTSLSM